MRHPEYRCSRFFPASDFIGFGLAMEGEQPCDRICAPARLNVAQQQGYLIIREHRRFSALDLGKGNDGAENTGPAERFQLGVQRSKKIRID